MLSVENTAQALGCDKDACFWFALYGRITCNLNANTDKAQKVILAEENVLNFNTEIFMT